MTDRRELETLIAKARGTGAKVVVQREDGGCGHPISIRVEGMKGVGPFPMSPISFAERMREVLR